MTHELTFFRAADPATLIISPIDDLFAIYHRASGQTHIVEPIVVVILETMGGEPSTIAALLDRLDRDHGVAGDAASLASRLDELATLGLVEQA